MKVSCAVCGSIARARLRVRGYRVLRCERCDLEFAHPIPTPAQLLAVYERDYFAGPGDGYRDYFGAERAATDAKARARLERLLRHGLRAPGTLLDVGCADGRLLLEARRHGLVARGVEVSPQARAQLPSALTPDVDEDLTSALGHGPFDAVTLFDVLEHLPDPRGTLRQIARTLAAGALVAIVVPVIDNANARWWPRSWDQYKPPEHLWYFSRRSLRALVEETLTGAVVYEGSAWRREARLFDAVRPGLGSVARQLGRLEGAVWRRAERAGALPEGALDDAWEIIVRCPGADRPSSGNAAGRS